VRSVPSRPNTTTSRIVMTPDGESLLERLRGQLKDAPGYYREIMAEAESPEATKKWSRIESRGRAAGDLPTGQTAI